MAQSLSKEAQDALAFMDSTPNKEEKPKKRKKLRGPNRVVGMRSRKGPIPPSSGQRVICSTKHLS